MKKMPLLAAALFAAIAYLGGQYDTPAYAEPAPARIERGADAVIAEAFANQQSKVGVSGGATVFKLLPDDNDGSRHQRFLIKLASGRTLLVAHNIDLAPRVEPIRAGDPIEFAGIYEWNAKGGVVHWTHRDPSGRHAAGWLKHNGQTYQ